MKVSIDPFAGFCFGVKRAIGIAESELQQRQQLYCLGGIVHNDEEIQRLEKTGLQTIDLNKLNESTGNKVLFRAHGEPPSTYKLASKNKIEIIDATCPVVLKFQKKVKAAWDEMKMVNGQVVIFGNKNHPEVIGLAGQTENKAIIVEDSNDLDKIDIHLPIRLFVQTTKNKDDFIKLVDCITHQIQDIPSEQSDFKFYNTICRQVSHRIPELKKFCQNHDIIIFISGKNSSNGRQLFNVCKSENSKSYFVSSVDEINNDWLMNIQSVGITGATSTPLWQMEQMASHISKI
jgi:4-hydroxy-3-methylbut-2-enyl diphosphate reductase